LVSYLAIEMACRNPAGHERYAMRFECLVVAQFSPVRVLLLLRAAQIDNLSPSMNFDQMFDDFRRSGFVLNSYTWDLKIWWGGAM